MTFVAWLDRRLVPLCLTLLGGSFACWLLALAVILTGCAGGARLDDTPPTTGENRCGETGACQP